MFLHQESWSWICRTISAPVGDFDFLQLSSCIRHRADQKCLAHFSSYLTVYSPPITLLCYLCMLRACIVEDYTELHLLLPVWSEQGGSWMTALPLLRSGTSVMSPDSRYQHQRITHSVWQRSSPETAVYLAVNIKYVKSASQKKKYFDWVYTKEILHLEFP